MFIKGYRALPEEGITIHMGGCHEGKHVTHTIRRSAVVFEGEQGTV